MIKINLLSNKKKIPKFKLKWLVESKQTDYENWSSGKTPLKLKCVSQGLKNG